MYLQIIAFPVTARTFTVNKKCCRLPCKNQRIKTTVPLCYRFQNRYRGIPCFCWILYIYIYICFLFGGRFGYWKWYTAWPSLPKAGGTCVMEREGYSRKNQPSTFAPQKNTVGLSLHCWRVWSRHSRPLIFRLILLSVFFVLPCTVLQCPAAWGYLYGILFCRSLFHGSVWDSIWV